MTADNLFSLAGTVAVAGWLVLILLPRWRYGAPLIGGVLIPGLLGLAYAYLIVRYLGTSEGGFGSLADVRALFTNDFVLLAGWIHYLAFDLFIGAWEVRDAGRHRIHHLAVVPCLGLTFMFGPIGLLAYLGLRVGWKRKVALDVD